MTKQLTLTALAITLALGCDQGAPPMDDPGPSRSGADAGPYVPPAMTDAGSPPPLQDAGGSMPPTSADAGFTPMPEVDAGPGGSTPGGGTFTCCVDGARYDCPDAEANARCSGSTNLSACISGCGSDAACLQACLMMRSDAPPDPSACTPAGSCSG